MSIFLSLLFDAPSSVRRLLRRLRRRADGLQRGFDLWQCLDSRREVPESCKRGWHQLGGDADHAEKSNYGVEVQVCDCYTAAGKKPTGNDASRAVNELELALWNTKEKKFVGVEDIARRSCCARRVSTHCHNVLDGSSNGLSRADGTQQPKDIRMDLARDEGEPRLK